MQQKLLVTFSAFELLVCLYCHIIPCVIYRLWVFFNYYFVTKIKLGNKQKNKTALYTELNVQ